MNHVGRTVDLIQVRQEQPLSFSTVSPRGVGIMLSHFARQALTSWKSISKRIITARFSCKVRNICIIQCYAPTELASDQEKDEFYSRLSAVYCNSPRVDIVTVMGDLNA